VTELQGGYQIAVVKPDNSVDIRSVKPAERVNSLWVIDEGLSPGDRVVTEGVQKVRQGMTVTPINAPVDTRPSVPAQPGR
jgi:membrane fusion protein (multidrug efflux system)